MYGSPVHVGWKAGVCDLYVDGSPVYARSSDIRGRKGTVATLWEGPGRDPGPAGGRFWHDFGVIWRRFVADFDPS